MSEKDYVNKILSWIQALIGGIFVLMIGLISYVFMNYENLNGVRKTLVVVAFIGLFIALLVFGKLALTNLKKLRRLN